MDDAATLQHRIDRLEDIQLQAAQHIGRLFEQRQMLMYALERLLDHAEWGHAAGQQYCPYCADARGWLSEVQRLRQKYG